MTCKTLSSRTSVSSSLLATESAARAAACCAGSDMVIVSDVILRQRQVRRHGTPQSRLRGEVAEVDGLAVRDRGGDGAGEQLLVQHVLVGRLRDPAILREARERVLDRRFQHGRLDVRELV